MNEPTKVTVTLQLGGTENVDVKQITVSQFQAAFRAYESEDEMRLVELSTGQHPKWCDTLSVESYEELVRVMNAVNASGFFAYAVRLSANRAARQAMADIIKSGGLSGLSSSRTSPSGRA